MSRISISFVALFFITISFSAPAVQAQGGRISSVDATRAGLVLEWTTQVDIASQGGRIVDIQLNVNEDRSHTFFAIHYGGQREVISEFDIGPFGVPFGTNPRLVNLDRKLRKEIERRLASQSDKSIAEDMGVDKETIADIRQEIIDRVIDAKESAENRQEQLVALMELQSRDVEVKLEKYTLPQSTIFVTTTTGFVQAIDADTGTTQWSASVGNRNYPTIGLGASNEHVAVVNGSTVYCLDALNGRQLWKRQCRSSVGSSPTVSSKFIFVPLVSGRLEAFSIEGKGIGAESFVSIGRAHSRPLITDDSVCWATDRGYFTVASNDQVSSPHYRLRTESSIDAPGTASGGNLFVAAKDGYAYGIDESRGALLWQFSTGQRLMQSPIPLGNYVYLITDEHQMFKLFADTGILAPGWSPPVEDVSRFVGASKDKIYVQNKVGQIVALNHSNGKKVSSIGSLSTDLILPNYQSDRLYVGNGSGSVQCLRELASVVPYFHADEVSGVAVDEAQPDPNGAVNEGGEGEATDPFAEFDDEKGKPDPKKEETGEGDPFDPFDGGI